MNSNILEVFGDFILGGLEYFITGLIVIAVIGLALAPPILTFVASGVVQKIAIVLLAIEVIIFVGYTVQNW